MKARVRARSAVGRTRRRLDGVLEGVGDGGGGGVRLVEGPGMGDDGSRRGRLEGSDGCGEVRGGVDCRAEVSGRPPGGRGAGVVEVAGAARRSNSVAGSCSESSSLGLSRKIVHRKVRNYFV